MAIERLSFYHLFLRFKENNKVILSRFGGQLGILYQEMGYIASWTEVNISMCQGILTAVSINFSNCLRFNLLTAEQTTRLIQVTATNSKRNSENHVEKVIIFKCNNLSGENAGILLHKKEQMEYDQCQGFKQVS